MRQTKLRETVAGGVPVALWAYDAGDGDRWWSVNVDCSDEDPTQGYSVALGSLADAEAEEAEILAELRAAEQE